MNSGLPFAISRSFLVKGLAVLRRSIIQFEPVWAETENYPAQKLELLSPQNSQGGLWKIKGTLIFWTDPVYKHLFHWLSEWFPNSQTVKARDLKFWKKVHLLPPVMCHVSHVTCEMPCVTYHMSHVFIYSFIFFYKGVKLVNGGSVFNGAYPV